MVKKGTFVRIEKTILTADERTSKIPEDTKSTPFVMWTKGVLQNDCEMGGEATVLTMSTRQDTGKLVEVEPMYELNYGDFLEEMIQIDLGLKNER
ncbi:MAG: 2-amino-4-oxopentanoate thiolase subunit OrtA [Erysipelotrichales bacterium]